MYSAAPTEILASLVFVTLCLIVYRNGKPLDSGKEKPALPPMAPYWIPFNGHLIPWVRDSLGLSTQMLAEYGVGNPFGLKLGPFRIYFFSNPEHTSTLMTHVNGISDVENVCMTLTRILGISPDVVKTMYRDDNSGPGTKPYPGSNVPYERRARHHMTKSTRENLAGNSGVKLGTLYKQVLLRNLKNNKTLKEEWKSYTDLWEFTYEWVFPAATEVMFGKRILELNPLLRQEIQGSLADIPTFLSMWPRWLRPAAFRRREIAVKSIRKWVDEIHDYSSGNADWNPDFGCAHIRDQHRNLNTFPEMTREIQARDTFGFFMGAIPNSLAAIYWTIFEVFTRPELVERIRSICESVVDPKTGDIDSIKLCQSPLLRSVLSEVLRMRVQGMIMRYTTQPVQFKGFQLPANSYLASPSNFGGFNEKVWNTGTAESPHPVDTFWSDRFLIYQDDPESGPVRVDTTKILQNNRMDDNAADDRLQSPIYSEAGLKGTFFPFGGGQHPCPGRQFAIHEVLNTLAILILQYDVEICVDSGWTPRMNTKHYGIGTLPPFDKVPCRIRRKTSLVELL